MKKPKKPQIKIDPKHPFFKVLEPGRPVWAICQDLNQREELMSHRRFREGLVKECGTDDVAVLAAKVKRVQTIACGRCGKSVEAISVGENHHVTENHVCQPRPQTFTFKLA